MTPIWKYNLSAKLKNNLFWATVESILVYGSITWTLASSLEKNIDVAYTRMLRAALNKIWQDHTSNNELYGNIPRITIAILEHICSKIAYKMRFSGHCCRSREELFSEVFLWQPLVLTSDLHGQRKPGRPQKTYTVQLKDDSGCTTDELKTAMGNRDEWRKCVMLYRERSTW